MCHPHPIGLDVGCEVLPPPDSVLVDGPVMRDDEGHHHSLRNILFAGFQSRPLAVLFILLLEGLTEGLKQKLNPKEAKRGSVISPDVTDPPLATHKGPSNTRAGSRRGCSRRTSRGGCSRSVWGPKLPQTPRQAVTERVRLPIFKGEVALTGIQPDKPPCKGCVTIPPSHNSAKSQFRYV